MKKLVFLIFGLGGGLFGPSVCAAKNEIQLTAVVQEHLTYITADKGVNISTNLDAGYWELTDRDNLIIVTKF